VTIEEFCWSVVVIRRKFRGSITSWGRTDVHAIVVGGFAGDPHTWDLGVDMIYDEGPPQLETLQAYARSLGLKVIRETHKIHDHYQPLDFAAGPVTTYDGEVKIWV
jgi:hypothetical protein